MQKTINGAMLKSMFTTSAKLLEINRQAVDALNVFPVPDGDTGTNMSMTLQSSVKELLKCQSNKIDEISDALLDGWYEDEELMYILNRYGVTDRVPKAWARMAENKKKGV